MFGNTWNCINIGFIHRMVGSTYIECVSGARAEGLQADMSASVQVRIDSATVVAEGVSFQYKQDPVFVSLAPQKAIPS